MAKKKSIGKMIHNYDKIKVTEKLDYDQLYEIIKDGNYPAGSPEITGKGIMRAIRFPASGKYQLMASLSGNTIVLNNNYSGAGGLAKEMIGDSLTGGFFGLFNKERQDGNDIVDEVGAEMSRLFDEAGILEK